MNDQSDYNTSSNSKNFYYAAYQLETFTPRLLHKAGNSLTLCQHKYNNDHPFLKMPINRMLAKISNKDNIYYKELLFDAKSDLLRRYYTKTEGLRRKADLYKLYQFAIPKPKIYFKDFIRLHFRYYYIKRKLREDTLREILHQIDDSDLHKLNVEYLEHYVRNRMYILNEISPNKPSLLKEIGVDPESMNKKTSLGLSISKILCVAEPTIEDSMIILGQQLNQNDAKAKSKKSPNLNNLTETNTCKKVFNFKKPAKQTLNNKNHLLKMRSGLTERITARISDKVKKVMNEKQSVYSSSFVSCKKHMTKNNNIPNKNKYKGTNDCFFSSRFDSKSNNESRSILTYSDKQFEVKNQFPAKRISLFKALAPHAPKLATQNTFQKNDGPINNIIKQVKLQRLNTEPLHLANEEADESPIDDAKKDNKNCDSKTINKNARKRLSYKKNYRDIELERIIFNDRNMNAKKLGRKNKFYP